MHSQVPQAEWALPVDLPLDAINLTSISGRISDSSALSTLRRSWVVVGKEAVVRTLTRLHDKKDSVGVIYRAT